MNRRRWICIGNMACQIGMLVVTVISLLLLLTQGVQNARASDTNKLLLRSIEAREEHTEAIIRFTEEMRSLRERLDGKITTKETNQ